MSSKVPLYFQTKLSSAGPPSIRLLAWAVFKSGQNYLEAEPVIIDTGAPVSLIPFNIWGQCSVKLGERATIYSVVDQAECDIGVTEGEITFSLVDEHGEEIVKDLKISAYLCDTSEMPPILGWHDFLSQGRLHIDYAADEASLELA